MSNSNEVLLIFQKNAELGKVKTRLAATIGAEKALQAYLQLCNYTHHIARQCDVNKKLYFSSFKEGQVLDYGGGYQFAIQSGNDLGDKMKNAFRESFAQGFVRVVIIGTDCPELSTEIITTAFEELRSQDAIIGPAEDGGYYLLGMSRYIPGIFDGIPWSTDQVSRLTIGFIEENNYSYTLLPTLSDVDNEADWRRTEEKLRKFKAMY